MAINLISKSKHGKIALLTLDAVEKETHHSSAEATDSPVEEGVAITDHVRPKPDEVMIEGWVTNTPIPPPGSSSLFLPGLAENAYADLLDLKDNPRLVTVVTSLRTYEDVVLIDLQVPRDAKTGEALHFTAQFKQIRIITNETIIVTRSEPKTKQLTDLSKKGATNTPAAVDKKGLAIGILKQIAPNQLQNVLPAVQ
jgi:hypothetical protein